MRACRSEMIELFQLDVGQGPSMSPWHSMSIRKEQLGDGGNWQLSQMLIAEMIHHGCQTAWSSSAG